MKRMRVLLAATVMAIFVFGSAATAQVVPVGPGFDQPKIDPMPGNAYGPSPAYDPKNKAAAQPTPQQKAAQQKAAQEEAKRRAAQAEAEQRERARRINEAEEKAAKEKAAKEKAAREKEEKEKKAAKEKEEKEKKAAKEKEEKDAKQKAQRSSDSVFGLLFLSTIVAGVGGGTWWAWRNYRT